MYICIKLKNDIIILINFISTIYISLSETNYNDLEINPRINLFQFYNCINFLVNLTDKCILSAYNSYNFFYYNSFGM